MKSNGKVLTGTFISNAKGFGFVEVEGRDEDLFIPEDKQGGAFHKDTVEVEMCIRDSCRSLPLFLPRAI